jgi:dTDP-4-dehydrorhamnose reductase
VLEEFGVKPESFEAIKAADWARMRPESAHRPAFSVLDLSRAEAAMNHPMRHWREALRDYRLATAANP